MNIITSKLFPVCLLAYRSTDTIFQSNHLMNSDFKYRCRATQTHTFLILNVKGKQYSPVSFIDIHAKITHFQIVSVMQLPTGYKAFQYGKSEALDIPKQTKDRKS